MTYAGLGHSACKLKSLPNASITNGSTCLKNHRHEKQSKKRVGKSYLQPMLFKAARTAGLDKILPDTLSAIIPFFQTLQLGLRLTSVAICKRLF